MENNRLKQKRPFKIILLIIGILFFLLITSLVISWMVFKNRREWIIEVISSSINESQPGELSIGSLDYSPLKYFPKAGIVLRDIKYYHEKKASRQKDRAPMIEVNYLDTNFNIWHLITSSELRIDEVNLKDINFTIIKFNDSTTNISKAFAKPEKNQINNDTDDSAIEFDLREIKINNLNVAIRDEASDATAQFYLEELLARISYVGSNFKCDLSSKQEVKELYLNNKNIPSLGFFDLGLSLMYNTEQQFLKLDEGSLKFENLTFDLTGSYDHKKGHYLEVKFDANANNLEVFSELLSEQALSLNEDILQNGSVFINGSLVGSIENKTLQVNTNFGINNLSLKLPNEIGAFENIAFIGSFNSGAKANFEEAVLKINNLKGVTPRGKINGELMIKNFVRPYVKYDLSASTKLDGIDKVFKINEIEGLKGQVSLQMKYDGIMDFEGDLKMDKSSVIKIELEEIGFRLIKPGNSVSNLSGSISEDNNQVIVDNFQLNYNESDLTINGRINNLYHFLFQGEDSLAAAFSINSNKLFTQDFLPADKRAIVQEVLHQLNLDFSFITTTEEISATESVAKFNFQINQFSFKPEKLVDINDIRVIGELYETPQGYNLRLTKAAVEFPKGSVSLSAELALSNDNELLINANLISSNLPINYVNDLFAEINPEKEPETKSWPEDSLDLVNIDLSVSGLLKFAPFEIGSIHVDGSKIELLPANQSEIKFNRTLINLDHMIFTRVENANRINGIKSVKGEISIGALKSPVTGEMAINMDIKRVDEVTNINFSVANDYVKNSEGTIKMVLSENNKQLEFSYNSQNIDLSEMLKHYQDSKLFEGNVDLTLNLETNGNNLDDFKRNLDGNIIVAGDSILLHGIALDEILHAFERSQKFNLVDLSAFVLAGPLGTAVTKGSNFSKLLNIELMESDSSQIPKFIAKWRIADGSILTEDVAFSTTQNRIAFSGEFDFVNDTIPGFSVAILDKKGCSLIDQRFYGKADSIQFSKVNITKTLMGSVINAVNAIVGKDCKPVYVGEIKHPQKK